MLFVNYCLNCHAASSMRYNRLKDIGLTDEQIKNNLLFTSDKVGEMMTTALRPADDEIVIGKHRVNALHGTDLGVVLRAKDIHTLIMLGFATSGVILSTTRYAADEDYRIVILEDCCADFDPEVHDFLCRKVLNRQADVVQSPDLIKELA